MAASTAPLAEQGGIAGFLARRASEALGALLILAALAMALALLGHNPNDPSLNHATVGPVANPLGYVGASIADLGLQMFGYAVWVPVIVLPAWGLRLILGAPFDLSWMRIVALPPAILASAGWLATFAVPASWPYWLGLGGSVGDVLLHHLQWLLGPASYAPVTLALALACLGFALWCELWLLCKAVAAGLRRLLFGAPEAEQPRWAEAVDQRLGDRRNGRQPAPRRRLLAGELRPRARHRRPPRRGPAPGRAAVSPGAGATQPRAGEAPPAMRRRPATPAEAPAAVPAPQQAAAPAVATVRPVRAAARPAGDAELVADAQFKLPPLRFLAEPRTRAKIEIDRATLTETAQALEKVLDDFGVRGEIVDVRPGPVVTLYELEPAPGTRAARVISLADDIARSLCAMSVRVAVVPGRNVIGIELPNEQRETVYLRDLLSGPAYEDTSATLTLALGKDIGGEPIVVDLARMPHLLIAGTTGSGKSVAINAMILSLLYRLPPDQCKLIMIDPKVIELSVYEGIPHLLAPVVTEPQKAVVALKWVVREMDDRYRLMSHLGVRDIAAYNRRIGDAMARGEQLSRRVQTGFEPGTGVPIFEQQPIRMMHLPLIVVVVDEVADLMLTAGKEIEFGDPAAVAEGARRRHPPDRRDPAALGRRADRRDQGQPAEPDQLPGQLQDRQPDNSRRAGRRAAARPGRSALYDAGGAGHPHPRAAGHRRGGRARGRLSARAGRAGISGLGHRRGRARGRQHPRHRLRRPGQQRGRAVRAGRADRGARGQGLDQLPAAQDADRLQQRRPPDRAHGEATGTSAIPTMSAAARC